MSEEQPPPAEPQKPLPKWRRKKVAPQEPIRSALIALIEEARAFKTPNMGAIARRYGVKYDTLKSYYYRWREGMIDLDLQEETSALRIEIDTKQELDRCLRIVRTTEQLLNDGLEATLFKIKRDMQGDGKADAIFENKLDKYLQLILQAARVRETKEKGYIALIEAIQKADEITRRRRAEETQSITVPAMSTTSLSDQEVFERMARQKRQGQEQEGVTIP